MPQSPQAVHDLSRSLLDMVESGAPKEQIQAMEQKIAQSAGLSKFALTRMLPHFVQAMAKNVNAATVYEHFNLPGRDRIVHDRRDAQEGGAKEAAKEGAKEAGVRPEIRAEMEIKEGRLIEAKDKEYKNYLADKMERAGTPEKGTIREKVEQMLSKFERLILERFEKGRKVAHESADGKAKFLNKTEAEWKDFFAAFRARIIGKKISFEEIGEFLFRGMVMKGGKGVIISDMILRNGQVEKFIRFSVIADLLAKLQNMKPGDTFGKDLLRSMGEDFMYLALAASRGKDMATSPLPAEGKFLSGKAEELAAKELGLALPGQAGQKEAGRRMRARKGLFGMILEEDKEREPDETPYQFVPWWHWGRLKRPGRPRWVTVTFYLALLAVSLMGIAVITYQLFSGR